MFCPCQQFFSTLVFTIKINLVDVYLPSMPQKLIEKITLPNGLILELWDTSRSMTGDRWLVSLLARMEVPVLLEYFSTLNDSEQAHQELISAYGDPLIFTQEKVRHFVNERDINEVLTGLCQQLKDNLVFYLGNPRFGLLYVMKKYGDLKDRQDWTAEETLK